MMMSTRTLSSVDMLFTNQPSDKCSWLGSSQKELLNFFLHCPDQNVCLGWCLLSSEHLGFFSDQTFRQVLLRGLGYNHQSGVSDTTVHLSFIHAPILSWYNACEMGRRRLSIFFSEITLKYTKEFTKCHAVIIQTQSWSSFPGRLFLMKAP